MTKICRLPTQYSPSENISSMQIYFGVPQGLSTESNYFFYSEKYFEVSLICAYSNLNTNYALFTSQICQRLST